MGPVISTQDELGRGKKKTSPNVMCLWDETSGTILPTEPKSASSCQLGIKMKIIYSVNLYGKADWESGDQDTDPQFTQRIWIRHFLICMKKKKAILILYNVILCVCVNKSNLF